MEVARRLPGLGQHAVVDRGVNVVHDAAGLERPDEGQEKLALQLPKPNAQWSLMVINGQRRFHLVAT